ncbi:MULTISPECIES: hypothetical protein [unclassified Novosphingobium]|uniref:hypothetical protein n=1 Tax=unclassified Novosphingobium TaxID=2644732 RepID=UPI00105E4BA2|nr:MULTISPECIES: hypothetical protein [unclassified Novosphingobium]
MQKIAIALLLGLVCGCTKQHNPPPRPPRNTLDLLSQEDAEFVRSQLRLIGPNAVKDFESPGYRESKLILQKQILDSRSCVDEFKRMYAVREVQSAISRNDLRLFKVRSNGYAFTYYVPGANKCSFSFDGPDADRIRDLWNPSFGDDQHYEIIDECDAAMKKYAAQYNQIMLAMAPQSLELSCGGSNHQN